MRKKKTALCVTMGCVWPWIRYAFLTCPPIILPRPLMSRVACEGGWGQYVRNRHGLGGVIGR